MREYSIACTGLVSGFGYRNLGHCSTLCYSLLIIYRARDKNMIGMIISPDVRHVLRGTEQYVRSYGVRRRTRSVKLEREGWGGGYISRVSLTQNTDENIVDYFKTGSDVSPNIHYAAWMIFERHILESLTLVSIYRLIVTWNF